MTPLAGRERACACDHQAMPFIVTHDEWGVLVQPDYPAEWMPWSAPGAMQRAKRFKWRTDAVRATCSWPPAIRTRFNVVEVD